jgi:hypothetical protein
VMEKMQTSSSLDLVRLVLMAERPVPTATGTDNVVPLTRGH